MYYVDNTTQKRKVSGPEASNETDKDLACVSNTSGLEARKYLSAAEVGARLDIKGHIFLWAKNSFISICKND